MSLLGIAMTIVLAATVAPSGVFAFFGFISAIFIVAYAVLQLVPAHLVAQWQHWVAYVVIAVVAFIAGAEAVVSLWPH